ncbi:MAG: hypothetical protein FWE05_12675 [Defluviitaleaceae bacterium]|nr:hypothetical protein [Defluviitaleaceae bacterium]
MHDSIQKENGKMQKPFLNRQHLRYYELIACIVDFCSDWVDEEDSCEAPRTMSVDDSLSIIDSYGVPLVTPNDYLVCNAIRHLKDVINPWNKGSLWDILTEQCGFTQEECDYYKSVDYWQQYK